MSSKLLESLQSRFVCQRCGSCCACGGDMELTADEVGAITTYLLHFHHAIPKDEFVPVPFKPGYFTLKHRYPCFFYDPKTRFCTINEVKPAACQRFPYLSLRDDETTLAAVMVCKGATTQILNEYLIDKGC